MVCASGALTRGARAHSPAPAQSMAQHASRWQVPAALVLLGALFGGAGGLLRGSLGAEAAAQRDALAAAPVVDAGALATLNTFPPGTRVLAEGRIATAAAAPHGLVVFVLEQYAGTETAAPDKGRPRWRELARHAPAFTLQMKGTALPVAAGAYALQAPPHERAPDGGPVAGAQRIDLRLLDLSTRRVRGFATGDAVTVDATVAVAGDGTRVLQPLRLAGGDIASYRAARAAGVAALPLIGALFLAAGALLLALGIGLGCARARPPASPAGRA